MAVSLRKFRMDGSRWILFVYKVSAIGALLLLPQGVRVPAFIVRNWRSSVKSVWWYPFTGESMCSMPHCVRSIAVSA